MPFELFTRRALLVACTLSSGNKKLVVNVLLNTGCTGYALVNRGIARVLYNRLDIEPQPFLKTKTITAFNDQPAEQITYGVYPCLEVAGYRELTSPLLITNLGKHNMILGLPWMEAHGVVLDLHQRRLLFKENVCTHTGALPASRKVAYMS